MRFGMRRTEPLMEANTPRWIEEMVSDLKVAMRGFRKQPIFAVGVVALISLGIGPNAAIFSIVNHLLIAPLPFRDGNRMVRFVATSGGRRFLSSRPRADIELWRKRARAVESVTLVDPRYFSIGDTTRGPTESVGGVAIGPGATAFTGLRPLLGRDIVASDTLASAPPVVLLSYDLWRQKFAGRADALGKSMVLNQVTYTVIGVMPERFFIPFFDDQRLYPVLKGVAPDQSIQAIAKLRRGESVEHANSELIGIFAHLDTSKPEDVPFVERAVDEVPPAAKRTAYLMFGAVALVLVIACANVANLMVARAWTRRREFMIRSAMGARRTRLIRQVLVESLALSISGGAVGLAVAYATLRLISTQSQLSRSTAGARIEPVVLLWIAGLSVVTGVIFGIAPALFVSSNASEALKSDNRSVAGAGASKRLRSALAAGEVALAVVLLVVAGLLGRTIVSMQRADVGFQSIGLYGVPIMLFDQSFADSAARHALVENALDAVRAVPGVKSAALSATLPPDFVIAIGQLEIDGGSVTASDSLSVSNVAIVRPDFFAFAGVRIVEGRVFEAYRALTDRLDTTEVVVNEGFARRFWPNGGAIGARIRRGAGGWATIVGVANDISIPGAGRRTNAVQLYQAMGASPRRAMILFRSNEPLPRILPAVTAAIHTTNPEIKIGDVHSSDDVFARWRATNAFTLRLIGAFALLALVLAAFGLHATIAYSVSQRRREIGIRVALGAQSGAVMRLVLGEGVRLAMAGVVVGAAGGVLAGRAMRALLYRVAPTDPATLVAVCALLGGTALLASYAPARRALSVDPAETLRAE
ncbi:MAG: ADOP family duplicated permease [Gemmatimonadaceae bacterium]